MKKSIYWIKIFHCFCFWDMSICALERILGKVSFGLVRDTFALTFVDVMQTDKTPTLLKFSSHAQCSYTFDTKSFQSSLPDSS